MVIRKRNRRRRKVRNIGTGIKIKIKIRGICKWNMNRRNNQINNFRAIFRPVVSWHHAKKAINSTSSEAQTIETSQTTSYYYTTCKKSNSSLSNQ
jgi:hypothetical protein